MKIYYNIKIIDEQTSKFNLKKDPNVNEKIDAKDNSNITNEEHEKLKTASKKSQDKPKDAVDEAKAIQSNSEQSRNNLADETKEWGQKLILI